MPKQELKTWICERMYEHFQYRCPFATESEVIASDECHAISVSFGNGNSTSCPFNMNITHFTLMS